MSHRELRWKAKSSSSDSSSSGSDTEVDDNIRQAAQVDYLQPATKRAAPEADAHNNDPTGVEDTVAIATDYRSLNLPDLLRRRMQERLDALCERRLRFREFPAPASDGDQPTRPQSPPALLSARTLANLQPRSASEQQQQQPIRKKPRCSLHVAQSEELKLLAVNPADLFANSGVASHRSGSAKPKR